MSVLVYIQLSSNSVMPISYETIDIGAVLAKKLNTKLHGLLIADKPTKESILALCEDTGLDVLHIYDSPIYTYFTGNLFADAAVDCTCRIAPEIFLLGSTYEVRAFIPATAAALKTGITADCTDLSFNENGLLLQTRPAFSGDVMATIYTPHTHPQIATIRNGMIRATNRLSKKKAQVVKETIPPMKVKTAIKVVSFDHDPDRNNYPNNQRLIIAVGGGVKAPDDLKLFKKLAEKFGAALGCSRSLTERGWMPSGAQIGISGVGVSPDILITFGISGSIQFLSGVKKAKKIISINTDANAPIFSICDIGYICDMYEVAGELLEES